MKHNTPKIPIHIPIYPYICADTIISLTQYYRILYSKFVRNYGRGPVVAKASKF